MKLLTYDYRGLSRLGVYVGERIGHIDRLAGLLGVPKLAPGPSTMRELIESWESIQSPLRALVAEAEKNTEKLAPVLMDPAEVVFLPPVPNPSKNVLCMGLNYKDHVEEGLKAKDVPTTRIGVEHPIFFTKAPSTLVGHGAEVPILPISERYDYEAELAVIIGKRGRDIPKDKVYDHVFGYCCGNDISVRDIQRRHKQLFKGKTIDMTCPLGPYIVLKEDYGDPMNKRIQSWVNGEPRQNSNTNMMIHDIPSMLSVLSEGLTLEPGDIYLTGTPSGVGFARETPTFLKAGDVVEVGVEGLGRLVTKMVAP